ncbi:MAG TPA: metallophosphoesterase family protein [Candidatus Dormibacteraeota bacterium]|nr:metallophosphoesterase family protein [Candidatus Dormibacteraeota bacterium]
MTTRVGVISDTHCPEFLERLPDRIFAVLRGVQLIVHAGDITSRSTLEQLEQIAPVHAVRGDHDHELASLPRSREITVEGRKIVVVHGDRSRLIEEPNTFLWTISLGYFHPHAGLPRSLQRRFPDADVIVYGHTHRSHMRRVGRSLLFNPGGVHVWNRQTAARRLGQNPGWFEWCWLQVARHIRRPEPPSVGILEIDEDGIVPRIIGL